MVLNCLKIFINKKNIISDFWEGQSTIEQVTILTQSIKKRNQDLMWETYCVRNQASYGINTYCVYRP